MQIRPQSGRLQHAASIPQVNAGGTRWTGFQDREADRVPVEAPVYCPARDRQAVPFVALPLAARTPRLPVPVDQIDDASLAAFHQGLLAQQAELEILEAADLVARQARFDAQSEAMGAAIDSIMELVAPYRQAEPKLTQYRNDALGAVARVELTLEGVGGLRSHLCGRRASPDHGAVLGHPIRYALRVIDAETKRRDVEKQAKAAKLNEVRELMAELGVAL